jgi:regulatory protein
VTLHYPRFGVQISTRLWHKCGVARYAKTPRPPKPLNPEKLRDLALHYVGRYATSRAKLAAYLQRKIRERGWTEGVAPPNIEALVEDFDRLGYVDDAAFAASRARSLTQRGYGVRRVSEDLRAKGITEADGADALDQATDEAWQSAERFARRKRIGPYAAEQASPELRQKQLQAFLRAGHGFDIARVFVRAAPGEAIDYST